MILVIVKISRKIYVVINSVVFMYVKLYLIKMIGIKVKVFFKKCVREICFW